MTTFTTIRETKKALLLETTDGRQFWIQRRWMRENGTLTPAGEKAMAVATTPAEKKAAAKARREEMLTLATPARETAKAFGYSAEVYCVETDQHANVLVWFPKSMIRDNAAPRWLVATKEDDAIENIAGRYGYPARSLQVDGLTA